MTRWAGDLSEYWPSVPAVICLAAGILVAWEFDVSPSPWSLAALIPALGIALVTRNSRGKLAVMIATGVLLFLAGLHLTSRELQRAGEFRPSAEKCIVHATVGQSWARGPNFRILLLERGMNVTEGVGLPGRGRLYLRDNEVALCAGDKISFKTRVRKPINRGNPGEYDWETDCTNDGIFWLASVQGKDSVLVLGSGSRYSPSAILFRIRESMARFIETRTSAFLPETAAPASKIQGILKGIILGDMGDVDPDLNQSFADSGLVHMLSASGLHVGIVVVLTIVLTKALTRTVPSILLYVPFRKAAAWASIPAMVVYCMLVGARVPAVRSAIMGLVAAVAILLNKRWHSLNSLAMAAVIILLIYPLSLLTPSFQLSFVAVAGILIMVSPVMDRLYGSGGRHPRGDEGGDGSPRLSRRLFHYSRPFTAVVLTSAAATLAVFPFLVQTFHSFPVYTLFANLTADFMMTGALSIGLIAALVGTMQPDVASLLLAPAAYLVWAIVELSRFFATLPGSTFRVPHMGMAEAILVTGMVFFILWYIREPFRKKLLAVTASGCCLLGALVFSHWFGSGRDLDAVFLNVGKGDAAFVKGPGSPGFLIDGGLANEYFDSGRSIVIPFLQWYGNRGLEGIVISHPEMDHMGGLLKVIGRVPPQQVWWNPVPVTSPHLDSVFAAAEAQGAPIRFADRTHVPIQIGSVTLRFLNPPFRPHGGAVLHQSLNNASVICKLEYGDVSFLFTGDLEAEGEKELIASGLPLAASVLKVPHHGSKTSTTRAFLEAVRPRIAVISCEGPILQTHPNRDVVERLETAGAQVFITGRDGAVSITSDGKDLRVRLGRPVNKRKAIWSRPPGR